MTTESMANKIEMSIDRKMLRVIKSDVVKNAEAVDLKYVSDEQPGIIRVKKGKTFEYFYKNKKITDRDRLKRIKRLVIPPAWENVWICPMENGHLQATGYDVKARKQYKYHPLWIALRSKTKFYRLYSFGKVLPRIRKKVQKDLRLRGLPREKVLAALISLMEETNIRVGNTLYERLYGSFGLSTFKSRHVKLAGNHIRFRFTGKKGIRHNIGIKSKRLADIVRRCREIPGKDLFHYYDDNEAVQVIGSGDVNEYIREISGEHFTSKDFRTWAGSVECIRALKEAGDADHENGLQKSIVAALDQVSRQLGNSRDICKKYYVHPLVLTNYENGHLKELFEQATKGNRWLEEEEKILMKILSGRQKKK
jgi:DNA topoisomerase-1